MREVELDQDWENLLQIKAELLCLGIKATEDALKLYEIQNPYSDLKTGNVGLHFILSHKTSVLATITHHFNAISPYTIQKKNTEWMLFRDGKPCIKITPIPMPKWYQQRTTTGKPMSKIFLHEGTHYLHQTYQGCDYFAVNKGCKFCGTGEKWEIGSPTEIGEVAAAAYKENQNYQICLGGGTRLSADKGALYFKDCLQEIRKKVTNIPIWIEMVPPESNKYIQMLIDAGATSFGFNIEIWDDELRKGICPGKYEVSKERYFEAFEYVLEALGPNTVGSVLIVGLESIESTVEGVKELAKAGVQPCLLPFKPWNGSEFEKKPPADPADFIQVSKLSAKIMIEYGIDPRRNQGCLNCNSCTIDHDYFYLLQKEKSKNKRR
jgi:biotin synthase-related radical SAM superfamily protein